METTFKVPIRNLFYLLSYAEELPDLEKSLAAVEDELITYDLLVKMFHREIRYLIRRGLLRDYVDRVEETSDLGGRLLVHESLPSLFWRRPTLVCEKDVYTENILFNQIIKTSLMEIYQREIISEPLRRESFLLAEEFSAVEPIQLNEALFRGLYYDRLNVHYQRALHLAYLLFSLQLLSHRQGDWTLHTAIVTDRDLEAIFERFLFYFYKREQAVYRVYRENKRWDLQGREEFLPLMKTDVSLYHRKEKKKIIIDAKFYQDLFQRNFGSKSFRSPHLYQLFAYLQHEPKRLERRGILIYPYNGEEIHEVYQHRAEEGLRMEVMTLNLASPWSEIRRQLLNIVQEG